MLQMLQFDLSAIADLTYLLGLWSEFISRSACMITSLESVASICATWLIKTQTHRLLSSVILLAQQS